MYTLGSSEPEMRRLREQLSLYGDLADVTVPGGLSVCELGCGPGTNLWIAERDQQCNFTGIDSSADQIAAASRYAVSNGLNGRVCFLQADAANTGLPGGAFDVVLIRCLLVHLARPLEVVLEAARLLRCGGTAIIIEPLDDSVRCSGEKPDLLECWRAKTRYTRETRGLPRDGITALDAGLRACFTEVTAKPYVVAANSRDANRCAAITCNWMAMIDRVAVELTGSGVIAADAIERARRQAASVGSTTEVSMVMDRYFCRK